MDSNCVSCLVNRVKRVEICVVFHYHDMAFNQLWLYFLRDHTKREKCEIEKLVTNEYAPSTLPIGQSNANCVSFTLIAEESQFDDLHTSHLPFRADLNGIFTHLSDFLFANQRGNR